MFYGDFSGDKKDKFQRILDDLKTIFRGVYAADNLITVDRSVGFREDKKFVEAFKKNAKTTQERSLGWRLNTLVWAAEQARDLGGDFVECGVWHGFSFGVVCDYMDFASVDKTLYLYDTFGGIPDDYNSENRSNKTYEKENAEDPDAIFKVASKRFADYPNVKLVRGIVPDTFEEACPDKISLLHLDMNSAASEIAALNVLYDKIVPGGIIVFDDYGWASYKKQKIAEDAFMSERGQRIMELPSGQGLMIKK